MIVVCKRDISRIFQDEGAKRRKKSINIENNYFRIVAHNFFGMPCLTWLRVCGWGVNKRELIIINWIVSQRWEGGKSLNAICHKKLFLIFSKLLPLPKSTQKYSSSIKFKRVIREWQRVSYHHYYFICAHFDSIVHSRHGSKKAYSKLNLFKHSALRNS